MIGFVFGGEPRTYNEFEVIYVWFDREEME